MIPGGSSSGSAVAVAAKLVTFALGTDTAGSGRIPCGFTNTIGLKPTRGAIETDGVVPACRSLDCISIVAPDVDTASRTFVVAAGTSRKPLDAWPGSLRVGVPREDQRVFLDEESRRIFDEAVEGIRRAGYQTVAFDFAPFAATGRLLYEDAFLAERTAALGTFIKNHPDDVLDVTREIVLAGGRYSAVDLFAAFERRDALVAETRDTWKMIDVILVPTAPGAMRCSDVLAAPVESSKVLGTYTNFVNLMDLCALAVPNGFMASGFPVGITLIAPAHHEERLLEFIRGLLPLRPAQSHRGARV
jgi:allophanate hydrolase